jgi:hypothetical protein
MKEYPLQELSKCVEVKKKQSKNQAKSLGLDWKTLKCIQIQTNKLISRQKIDRYFDCLRN